MRERLGLNIFSLALLTLSIALSSCSKEVETEGFINIDDQYEIKIHQLLSPTGGIPSVYVSTLEPADCKNSYISHQTIYSNEKFQLILNDIQTEGACESGNEYIYENVPIEAIDLSTPFEINVKNVVSNEGIFYKNKMVFELKLNQFDGLKISKTKINRIHEDKIWGTFSSNSEEVANQLRQALQDTNQATAHSKGDYGYFYIAQDDSVTVYENDSKEGFLITSNISIEELESIILDFKQNDPSLEFQATYFDGRVLNIQ